MKNIRLFFVASLLAMIAATTAQSQNKVMQVHSGGNVVYALNASQIDSITFRPAYGNIDLLPDLPWLKEIVDELVLIIQKGNPFSAAIFQYVYGDGETGFLVDTGNTKPFYNWNGEKLCTMGGFVGNTCPELNIDYESEKLIWDTEEVIIPCKFTNPLTDLPCIERIIKDLKNEIEAGYSQHARIYQCSYKQGIGFLVERRAEDPSFGYMFRNCAGSPLCDEIDSCAKYGIDYENKKLIWEMKK